MSFRKTKLQTEDATHFGKQKQNPFFRLVKLIIWIVVILGVTLYYKYSSFSQASLIQEDQIITISEGENFSSFSKKFHINDAFLKFYLKQNHPEYILETGRYHLKSGSTIEEILSALKEPILDEVNVTLLEGWNIYDIDYNLTYKKIINKGDYIDYVTNTDKIVALTEFFPFLKGAETLEGFLYPDTYTIDIGTFKINNFVIKQLETFEKKVYEKILTELETTTIHDLINLASIVEKEEKLLEAKPIVAGILKKRLNLGWMIGADITVCYPYKLTSEECKLVVTKYIQDKNEYNTRTMRGLPKTPIGNPSYETIHATLNDIDTPYFFYLHDKTGKAHYSITNEEHTQKKYKYLR